MSSREKMVTIKISGPSVHHKTLAFHPIPICKNNGISQNHVCRSVTVLGMCWTMACCWKWFEYGWSWVGQYFTLSPMGFNPIDGGGGIKLW